MRGGEDRKRGIGVGDAEEGARDVVEERVRNERGEHGRGDEDRIEPGEQERLEGEENARHGVCMDPGNEAAHGAATDADRGPEHDTREHVN